MKTTVAKTNQNGMRFKVIFDDTAKCDQYTVYREYYDNGWHKQKIAASANMAVCLNRIAHEYMVRG